MSVETYLEKPSIKFIFPCGFRCCATEVLKVAGLRKMSGPFDYILVDLETAFKLITTNFDKYIDDTVEYKKSCGLIKSCYPKYIEGIDKRFLDFVNGPVSYMKNTRENEHYFYNQNFMDESLSDDLYEWKSICVFCHHNLWGSNVRSTLIRHCERFSKIWQEHLSSTLLFHVTKIITNIDDCIKNILELKNKYCIESHFVVVVCYDSTLGLFDKKCDFIDSVLFIYKPVESYDIQRINFGDDNWRYDYTEEIDCMKEYFTLDLVEKDSV
jgi:hypothetical protein